MKWRAVLAVLLVAVGMGTAQAQTHGNNPVHAPSTGLIFGNGTLSTGPTLPTTGQAVCNNSGVLGGCTTSSTTCVTLTGATPVLTPTNKAQPVTECFTQTLGASLTLTGFAAAGAPVAGWTAHIVLTQPSGSHNYTFTLTAGSGVSIVYPTTGGCPSLPTMPTGTGHSLLIDLLYNPLPSTPELDVLACVATGT